MFINRKTQYHSEFSHTNLWNQYYFHENPKGFYANYKADCKIHMEKQQPMNNQGISKKVEVLGNI